MNAPPELLDQVRDKLWVKHYAIRTEKNYVDWVKRYIYFHGKTHPKKLSAKIFSIRAILIYDYYLYS